MAVRKLVYYGDIRLSTVAEEVKHSTPKTRALVVDMLDTMRKNSGQGLSANQIGSDQAIIVAEYGGKVYSMMNPAIIWRSAEENSGEEGCLSVPSYVGMVNRNNRITLDYKDEKGKRKQIKAEGMLARIIQHEVDHICGILFVQRVAPGTLRRFKI